MAPSALTKKLRIQPGQRLLVLNAPAGWRAALGELPPETQLHTQPAGKHGFVLLFVKDSRELSEWVSQALQALAYDGLFWLAYPKKTGGVPSDLHRDRVWQLMEGSGLRPVAQVAIDEVWSALRFRPAELVGKGA